MAQGCDLPTLALDRNAADGPGSRSLHITTRYAIAGIEWIRYRNRYEISFGIVGITTFGIAEAIARKVRLRHVRCFVTVARKKSFVLASEDLGITQPAVSRSVRELEHILGHQLFDRSTRGAELTPQGRDFFVAAENSLNQIWQGTNAVIGNLGANETVRIGALPNVCSQFLPSVLKDFKTAAPKVRVLIIPGTNADLLGRLRSNECDFVLGRLSTSDDMRGLVFEALYDEPLVFVVRECHPLAGQNVTIEEVLGYQLLVPPEGTIIRQEMERYLAGRGVTQLSNLIETTSSDLQRAYLRMTDSIAITPRGVVQDELENREFVTLPLDEGGLSGPVGLTTNPDMRPSPAVQRFLTVIRQS
ncbi:MAG: LysR substrate-binding domain-containing protein [Pseudomonadota bacterium]